MQNAWQKLKFTLEDRIDGGTADNQINSVILLIDPNAFTGDTYYLDNFDLYGASGGGETATTMVIATVTTGTQSASKGQKYGKATVTVVDDLGAPVAGATVSGTFSGTWNETASGITDSNGEVVLMTTTTASGGVSVGFCVDTLTGTLTHDSASSTGLCL